MQAELKVIFESWDELAYWVYSFKSSTAELPATASDAPSGDAVAGEVAAGPVTDGALAQADASTTPATAAPKRTRRTKAEMAAAAQEPAAPADAPADQAPVTPVAAVPVASVTTPTTSALGAIPEVVTAESLRALFNKVNDKYGAEGLQKVTSIVEQFHCLRISELKPEQYAAAAAACEAALA